MYIKIPVKFFSYQLSSAVNSWLQVVTADENENHPRELKFGTHINFSVHMKISIIFFHSSCHQLSVAVNTYSVKPVLAKLGKNIQLSWVELSWAQSGFVTAWQQISKFADFKTRKMFANGLFISKLTYLIPLWGGCENSSIKALQVIQNKAARCVTRFGIYTPVNILLRQRGWLSVNQLVFFHTKHFRIDLQRIYSQCQKLNIPTVQELRIQEN